MVTDSPHGEVVEFGVFQLDLKVGQLRKSGRVISLAPQPFRVLSLLVRRQGELVTREEIRKEIWGDQTIVDFEAGLNFAMNKIRVALGDGAHAPRFVETVPRRGYRFVAPATSRQTSALPAEVNKPMTDAWPGPNRRRAWVAGAAICALILLVLFGSTWRWKNEAVPSGGVRSIAVLPFENLSRDDAVGDGTAEALITQLGKVSGLRVISRTSSFRYRKPAESLPEIGRKLGADMLVEGAVTVWDRRVRVTARLMEAATDRQLWSGAVERDLKDVLTLQEDLAHQIAAAASVRLSPYEKRELSLARVVNPEAYECYLRGRLLLSRQTDIRQSIREFEQAVAKDPRFAMAFAALADAYLQLTLTTSLQPNQPYQKARVAAQRALEIEPNLADAVNVLAEIAAYSWEWPEAVRLFHRALELNPSYAQAYHDYGFYLLSMGRVAEATEWAKKARLLDPLSVTFAADLAWMPYFLRQYDEAIRALQEVETMEPDSPLAAIYLAITFQQKGQFERAIAAGKRALELDAENYPALSTLAFVYGKAGRSDEAKRILGDLQAEVARRPVPAFHFTMIYLGLGDTEQALKWLERAYQERFYMVSIVNVMPEFDPVRADPRFQRIVRQMGVSP